MAGSATRTVTKTRISSCVFSRDFHPKRRGPIHGMWRRSGMPESTVFSDVWVRPPMTAVLPSSIVNFVSSRRSAMIG